MTSLAFETDEMRPIKAWCTHHDVHISLADGGSIATPLWWYPFLASMNETQLNVIELMYEGPSGGRRSTRAFPLKVCFSARRRRERGLLW